MTRTVYLTAAIGLLIGGTASVIQEGWTRAFTGAAVCAALVASLLLIRRLWLANQQHHQINHDELDDPDPFNTSLTTPPVTRIDDTDRN